MKLALLCAALVSCSAALTDTRVAPPRCSRVEHIVFHADPGFTKEEAFRIWQATDDWFLFTGGHADLTVSFDFDIDDHSEGPQIHRLLSNDPMVYDFERRHGLTSVSVLGWTVSQPPTVYLVVDRVEPEHVRNLAAHEFGHTLDLHWPGCSEPTSVCYHSPDKAALMAPAFTGQTMNESDRELCRATCLCP